MVARSRPVGMRPPHPPTPEDANPDADLQRLKQSMEALKRHLIGANGYATKITEQIRQLEQERAA